MRETMLARSAMACALALLVAASTPVLAAPSARQRYEAAVAREKALRDGWNRDAAPATIKQARAIVVAYEGIVRRHPVSGYCDNALWQGAELSADVFAVSHDDADRRAAARLFAFLAREYPTSPFAARAADLARRLESAAPANAPTTAKSAEASPWGREAASNASPARRASSTPASAPHPAALQPDVPEPAASTSSDRGDQASRTAAPPRGQAPLAVATIREIRRTVLAEVVRVSIEIDREVVFREERVEDPARLLFDLAGTTAAPAIRDANWSYADDIVRHIRVGRHPNQTTRVVLDLDGVSRYTVATLYNPYRILIDCERTAPIANTATNVARTETGPPRSPAIPARTETGPAPKSAVANAEGEPAKKEPPKEPPARTPAPLPPEKNDGNRVSMARQLGLGVARIVIDPGHGGKDPGADGPGISEAQIVLDIALRLEKALKKQQGVDIVLTRRTDVFIPLEERTALANREQADLFLSIHANASRNQNARGIESYYLNFATNPDAEAVAARENSASERTMNSLTDIVKAIALNNKLDESKDFAGLVQQAMARRLKTSNKSLKDLGVKQAPFVVLIGAAMPSVLAEVSFVTNRREGQLLKTEAYRQRIADALADAVLRYQKTLKPSTVIAGQSR